MLQPFAPMLLFCAGVQLPRVHAPTVCTHAAFVVQVYSFPVYDMVQQGLWRQGIRLGWTGGRMIRVAYVMLISFVAVLLPFFGGCPAAAPVQL